MTGVFCSSPISAHLPSLTNDSRAHAVLIFLSSSSLTDALEAAWNFATQIGVNALTRTAFARSCAWICAELRVSHPPHLNPTTAHNTAPRTMPQSPYSHFCGIRSILVAKELPRAHQHGA